MRVLQRNISLPVLLVALTLLAPFTQAASKQEILDRDTDLEVDLTSKPTLARFAIEDFSPTEWQAEHERVRAKLGDDAYLALRQSEINDKSQSILKMIVTGQWKLPRIKGSQQPDRMSLANGREFRVGVAQGVPEDISEAMYASFENEGESEVPEEWLEFGVTAEELTKEERQANEERLRKEEKHKLDILEGRLSVRNFGKGCLTSAESESDLDKSKI